MSSLLVTWISTAIILFVFFWFGKEEYKLYKTKTIFKKLIGQSNLLDLLKTQTKIVSVVENYQKSITIETSKGHKSNIPASEYINERSICEYYKLNMRMLDAASGTLVGLGLLGTFLGLTYGIYNFDSTNTEKINESIQGLLSGMGTAFLTSLVGMSTSLLFTAIDKANRHRLYQDVTNLTDELDALYYIDDMSVLDLNQQKNINRLYTTLKADIDLQTQSLIGKLTYMNADNENVSIGNAIREILTENTKQSKALMSFSTDLAIELNQGFDEVLSRQMQEKILPLMESVDATTRSVVEHIDQMAAMVSSPAADMMQNIVDELKDSMQNIMKEFNSKLTDNATSELENLAVQLGTATEAMANFPRNMENISSTLQVTIEEVKNTVAEISNTSAHANSTAMQQMQEQIGYATGAIGDAISEVREVMSKLSQTSKEQSNQMLTKLADASEKMGSFLEGTIMSLSASVQHSVQQITNDVNSKQADLMALQDDTTTQTKNLLETFNTTLERLNKVNEYISVTMNGFKQAQGEISASTSNLRTISSDMRTATEAFSQGQNDYAEKLAQAQATSQKCIDQVASLLTDSGQLSEEYVQKFDIIKTGLSSIFAQLQNGLTEYSLTVKSTTDKYLADYTASLTQTTGALSSAIERQNEITEMLTDTISRYKK